ncbi:hypothetical protein D3C84_781270 [compost metagenome]
MGNNPEQRTTEREKTGVLESASLKRCHGGDLGAHVKPGGRRSGRVAHECRGVDRRQPLRNVLERQGRGAHDNHSVGDELPTGVRLRGTLLHRNQQR